MIQIDGKRVWCDDAGKRLHRVKFDRDIYFSACTLLGGEGIDDFEEVDLLDIIEEEEGFEEEFSEESEESEFSENSEYSENSEGSEDEDII